MATIDRFKILSQRLVEATMPSRVVFHHVPKCGGTSVGRALRKRFLLSQVTVKPEESFRAFEAYTKRHDRDQMLIDVAALREQMMLYHLYEDIRCISLHVPYSDVAYARFANRYKFVTILREPISRFVSHYFWSHGKKAAHARIDEDFEAFLNTSRARRLGASYVEYYSGVPAAQDLGEPELTTRAISNLRERFDFVGRLDDLAAFESGIRRTLGVRIRVGHQNRARRPNDMYQAVVTPELMARARAICAPDIAIWDAIFGAGARNE